MNSKHSVSYIIDTGQKGYKGDSTPCLNWGKRSQVRGCIPVIPATERLMQEGSRLENILGCRVSLRTNQRDNNGNVVRGGITDLYAEL